MRLLIALTVAGFAWPAVGVAQLGPRPQPDDKSKTAEEGPAEAAPPDEPTHAEPPPSTGWSDALAKTLQHVEIHGYLRARGFYFRDLNLGRQNTSGRDDPRPPFVLPARCTVENPCAHNDLTSADMRLRIEPTIHVGDSVAVHAQIDMLDNLVAGSMPARDGGPPFAFFSRSQSASIQVEDVIRVKRAWAVVRLPIAELSFGRMPAHWGAGMLINDGSCATCEGGTSVDRVQLAARVAGHTVSLFYDWVASGPTTRLYTPQLSMGPSYNADGLDDVWQVGLSVARSRRPDEIRDRLASGEVVLDYGALLMFRRQDWDWVGGSTVGGGGTSESQLAAGLRPRDGWALIPDVWVRLLYRKLRIEAELAMIGGRISSIDDQLPTWKRGADILQFGGVVRVEQTLLRDRLHIGLEVGFASGDAAEDVNVRLHADDPQRAAVDLFGSRLGRFQFHPDYQVDQILFRRLVGAVSNATYFKGSAQYDIGDLFVARVDTIYSIANVPVAWPGNDPNLGVEIDASLHYRDEKRGFHASLTYGLLIPLDGLSMRLYDPKFNRSELAHSLQLQLMVKF